jgi:hypothetical protein
MAKLGAVIDQWMEQTQVAISAAQCWTSLEEYSGVVPCTVMSMMSENLISSACDVDICGVVGEGEFTDDPLDTFGGAGVVRIPKLQESLRYLRARFRTSCRRQPGFCWDSSARGDNAVSGMESAPTQRWKIRGARLTDVLKRLLAALHSPF